MAKLGWIDSWMDGPLSRMFLGAQMLSNGRYCIGIEQDRGKYDSKHEGMMHLSCWPTHVLRFVTSTLATWYKGRLEHIFDHLWRGWQAGGCGSTMAFRSKWRTHGTLTKSCVVCPHVQLWARRSPTRLWAAVWTVQGYSTVLEAVSLDTVIDALHPPVQEGTNTASICRN